MGLFLIASQYKHHDWRICGDAKGSIVSEGIISHREFNILNGNRRADNQHRVHIQIKIYWHL